jgi:DNA-binding NarL/FixJ family response regulator
MVIKSGMAVIMEKNGRVPTRPRVLLADESGLLTDGLYRLLEPHFEMLVPIHDGPELLEATLNLKPDVIVADISLPRMNGIEVLRQMRKSGSEAQMIFLIDHAAHAYVSEALRAGAAACVLKRSHGSELIRVICSVVRGEKQLVDGSLANRIGFGYPGDGNASYAEQRPLTFRQLEVLRLVALGKSGKEIASTLNVSLKTVEFHKHRIMERLDVHTTAELTRYAVRSGLLSA